MKYILSALTIALFAVLCHAQPQHLGALFSTAGSDGKDGNGAINGIVVQGKGDLKPLSPYLFGLSVVGEAKFSRDYKGYLSEKGNAFRTRLLARYEYSSLFLQAGFYAAHVRFANTSPMVQNGYGKSIVQPVIGGGYHFTDNKKFDLTTDYLYFLNGKLHATDSTGKALGVDGTSRTHRLGVNTSYEFHPNWLLLTNASWNRSTYIRQCGYYGPDVCGIPHPSQGWEVQFGIGYKFGAKGTRAIKRPPSYPQDRTAWVNQ